MELNREIIDFVHRIIKIRLAIIYKNPKVNYAEAKATVNKLKLLINSYGYKTDVLAAKFLVNHFTDIESLLPGPNCSLNKPLNQQLFELYSKAKQLN